MMFVKTEHQNIRFSTPSRQIIEQLPEIDVWDSIIFKHEHFAIVSFEVMLNNRLT